MRKDSKWMSKTPWRASATVVLVAGLIGASASGAVAAPADGTLDQAFQVETGTGFDGVVVSAALQLDGKILTSGNFTTFDGAQAGKFARLNADGSLDTAFATEIGAGPNGWQGPIVVQADGKILTGGQQQTWDGAPVAYFSRLNADGSRDTAFNANLVAANLGFNVGQTITEQPDGKIILGAGEGMARVNSDGTRDQAFTDALGSGFANAVGKPTIYASELLPSGDIVAGGSFVSLNGTNAGRLVRLHSDGSLDAAFANNLGTGFNGTVSAVAPLADGSLVVGGSFTAVNGIDAAGVAKLNADGTVNTAFANTLGAGFNNNVDDVVVTAEGAILVAGDFDEINGTASPRLARISAAGVVDAAFAAGLGAGFDGEIAEIAVQPNGAIVAVGVFSNYNGTPAGGIARLTYTPGISILNPGEQSSKVNDKAELPIVAAHTDGEGSFSYSAEGLPPGLSIDPNTGVISGIETAAGDYVVTVTATHSSGASASTTFKWNVAAAEVIPGDGNGSNNGDNENNENNGSNSGENGNSGTNGSNSGNNGSNAGPATGSNGGGSTAENTVKPSETGPALATTGVASDPLNIAMFAGLIAALGAAALVWKRRMLAKG